MPHTKFFSLALLCASLGAGLLPLTAAHAQAMSKADHKTSEARIKADYKAHKAACKAQTGNAKDICQEEAKGKEKVALAELAYHFSGKASDRNHVTVVKAKAAYEVAKERCDELAGNGKDVCVQEAKAVEKKALANAKMGEDIGEAKKDAAADKLDADYKVALEKCNALAGDTKTRCVAAAKTTFGKN